ncbi:accessory factor UbiK family protein [Govanella unica]|uniref:Accessory factor UbiK family protein n=1 Tax=Govanella unica TaxID=2975056 RepID=A0A9X3Z887_9PROT|nr:accessory factor UbiK family protein [Govania unica]MDA5194779.1 accessory factor UbiK family protein [Govania unica]
MVQTQNKLFDDLAKLATGAAGTLHGVKAELEGVVRQRVERLLANMDLVTREEFEAVKAMAVEARRENEALKARLDALDGKSDV